LEGIEGFGAGEAEPLRSQIRQSGVGAEQGALAVDQAHGGLVRGDEREGADDAPDLGQV
jgi:hypothetical protein